MSPCLLLFPGHQGARGGTAGASGHQPLGARVPDPTQPGHVAALLFSLMQVSSINGREQILGVFGVWALDMGARLPITRRNKHPHWKEGEPKAREMGWPALGPPS